jgi:hypothetical protein
MSNSSSLDNQCNDRINYIFDSRGFYHFKGFLDPLKLNSAIQCFDDLNFVPEAWFPEQHHAQHIHKHDNFLGELQQILYSHPITHQLISYPHKLIESYAITRQVGFLDLHGGSSEYLTRNPNVKDISAKSWVQDGRIYSLRVKVLIYLDDVKCPDDGRFIYIEGSHKARFSFRRIFPEGRSSASELIRTLEVHAGDAIWLNEALLHGAEMKTSQHERRLLAYTYGPSFMSNWIDLEGSAATATGYFAAETEST